MKIKPCKPQAYYTCLRLGIPYDPTVRAEWRREIEPLVTDDDEEDSDSPTDESSDNAGFSPSAELREFTPSERETWILDAEYLEKSYLISGDPNPESLAWNIDPYESAWVSVGLILKDEAFQHVSYFILGFILSVAHVGKITVLFWLVFECCLYL